eukprot:IDg14488t1
MTENKCEKIAGLAKMKGLDYACSNSDLLDVFFAALSAALDQLRQTNLDMVHPTLRDTLAVCKADIKQNTRHPRLQTYSTPPIEYTGALARTLPKWASIRASGTRRGVRAKHTPATRSVLNAWFMTNFDNPYPSNAEKSKLALQCGITLSQVNNYFGNRRIRTKRKFISSSPPPISYEQIAPLPSSAPELKSKWHAIPVSNSSNSNGQTLLNPPEPQFSRPFR